MGFQKRSDVLKHAIIKPVLAIISAVLLAALISGCAVIPADISELESPPKLTGEQQAIEKALEAKAGNKFTLKYPLDGDYRSAFIMKDLDHDGTPEAIAFYSPQGGAGPHIAFFAKTRGKWNEISDIGSDGSEINNVAFGDFDGNGNDDIAVGWRSFNSTDLTLMVYSRNDKSKNGFTKTNLGSFTKLKTLDMDQDGNPDILLLKLDSDEKNAAARLISYRHGKLAEVAKAPLDSTVTSYAGVYVTKLNAKTNGVYVDGYKSSHNMITELVYYKDGKLITPFYDSAQHIVSRTLRSVTYQCTDINGDGIIEIPMPTSLPYESQNKKDSKNWLVNWSVFDGSKGLTPKLSCVMNYAENYYFTYPEKWNNSVTVKKVSDSDWEFCEWNYDKGTYGPELFAIEVYSGDDWGVMPNKSSFNMLTEKSGIVYAAELPEQRTNSKLSLSLAEIKKNFNLFNQ